eukprot:gnl/TRDRNA2_/TRDRNA2_175770_c0_seq1.p1 gnl/TRDRNA2_/TRDRNA2_175770_c0~~gnl/TRDRNA2_/TRDRNA2_175770_c0_seq1.p1  ORF type:complete len:129 (-),score=1.52 gnl/TRDRNA2_/TRDRNA2_175770_c0_seq1:27-413(-)
MRERNERTKLRYYLKKRNNLQTCSRIPVQIGLTAYYSSFTALAKGKSGTCPIGTLTRPRRILRRASLRGLDGISPRNGLTRQAWVVLSKDCVISVLVSTRTRHHMDVEKAEPSSSVPVTTHTCFITYS